MGDFKFPNHNNNNNNHNNNTTTNHHHQQRPTITIPPKPSAQESLLTVASPSPGAMAMASNFFSDNFAEHADFRSFSDLLAGAMSSPSQPVDERRENNGTGGCVDGSGSSGFRHNRPGNLVLPLPNNSSVFAVPSGFSPSAFLNSPSLFSPTLTQFGMSCQQHLAQATAQAGLSQANISIQADFHPSSSNPPHLASTMHYQPLTFNNNAAHLLEPSNAPHHDRRPPTFPAAVDKPADDGYNWRKYGQKQVKGSEYPRSYYRCTNPSCPVKKKVERSFDGHITEIIYKGLHNHDRPQNGRRGKDNFGLGDQGSQSFQWSVGLGIRDHEATSMQLQGPSDSEESGENQHLDEDEDGDEPNAKRRNTRAGPSDVPYTHRTMTEPKIVVQTRSDVDLLDDGYRWRKYGQKVVKGNPNPRSYYKCTTVGCKVRKHVERASTDYEAVVTTYEGKHNHDVPAARGSSSNINTTANNGTNQLRMQDSVGQMNFGNNNQLPLATLRMKEEQITV